MNPEDGAGADLARAGTRRFLAWVNVSVMTILMGAFLVLVNLIAQAKFARIDMTTDKVWEISPESKQILRNVSRDLEIYINLFEEGPRQDKSIPEAWRRTQRLLGEMAGLTPKIKVAPIVPGSLGLANVTKNFSRPEPDTLYFIYRTADDKPLTRAVPLSDLYQGNPQTGELLEFFGEPRIITTISQLISDRKVKIYHTVGHRELPPGTSDRAGLSVLVARLTALENAEFKPLDLAKERQVPDEADIVFIAAPISDFTTAETDALRKYWSQGGRLFVAVHPLIPDPLDEFRKFVESCGVRINRDLVADAERETGHPFQLAVRAFTNHPVNLGMPGQVFLMMMSCSVDRAPVRKNMQSIPLFFSSPNSWAETDLPPKNDSKHGPGERYGNVPLAVAADEKGAGPKDSRIIAWGGVASLTNERNLVGAAPNELTLGYITNNFRWLLEREVLIAGPGKARAPRMKPFTPPPGGLVVIGWISIAGIPLLGVALGALAWYFRRK